MTTAYHPVEMTVTMVSNNGPTTVNHHLHHQREGLFAAADEHHNIFYEPTTTTADQADYYSQHMYTSHSGLDPHHPVASTASSSGVYAMNEHTNHLMANEDGYWGSPCSSDSTNGRDYSPSESVNQAPASPYQHQYAPVYYPPQYDRPDIVYDDTGSYYSNGGGVIMATTTTSPSNCTVDGKMLPASSGPLTLMGGAAQQAGFGDATSTTTTTTLNGCVGSAGGGDAGMTEVGGIGGGPVPFVRVVKRRTTANKKERRRTQSINSAFTFLRDCIPNVPSDTKLSKIKTLRLATSYISYLTRVLEGDQDPSGGFRAELVPSSRKINAERRAKYEAQGLSLEDIGALCLSSSNSESTTAKKAKGRTGWPQHVWASELKQEQ